MRDVAASASSVPPHRIDDASMLVAALGTPLRLSGKMLDAQAVRQDTQYNICSLIYFFSCLIFVSTSRWTHVMIVELFIYELLVL